jgi:formylglycine-generating enzyme required for sulfatase activity
MMRNVSALLLAVSTLASAQTREKRIVPVDASLRQNFERQPKIAVLAGVGVYPARSGLSRLRYPAHDVELLEGELTKQGYRIVALKDQEATRGSVEQALKDAAELVDQGRGTVLFFFSGHGFADKGENYLATFEATSGDLADSGLSVKKVEGLLKATGAPRQVMFIDACRNEPGKSVGARSFERFQASAGLRELLSTKEGRISYEDDQLGSGVFTHFLVQGLQGGAAGQDGLITFRDLAEYVTDGVSTFGFQRGQMQVPYEAGESSGDFLLGRAMGGLVSEPVASTPNPPAPAPSTLPSAEPRPGDVKVNEKDGLKYVWIPPGKFMMGCSPGDAECADKEKPPHDVTISKGFWLGQTPVTQQAYEQFAEADTTLTGRKSVGLRPGLRVLRAPVNPSGFKGANLPVESVGWQSAQVYCAAFGGRLPTETEWEYAARAGTTTALYGDLDKIAWYNGNASKRTHEVAQKQPNAFGLYDMLGNVRQWTVDGDAQVLRGGSWNDTAQNVRVSARNSTKPGYPSDIMGFRCVGK